MVMISERPAEAGDRAVPGHWEGDLIMGARNASAIGTLAGRSTRFVMLLHLPHGRDPAAVAEAMTGAMAGLPAALRRSLTWDQGREMAFHAQIAAAADLAIYFCDPHSPWQRGSNENTNGLLRQYFPKGTGLSVHGRGELDRVAAQLNARPRKTLGWKTPPAPCRRHSRRRPDNGGGCAAAQPPGAGQATGPPLRRPGCCASRWRATALAALDPRRPLRPLTGSNQGQAGACPRPPPGTRAPG